MINEPVRLNHPAKFRDVVEGDAWPLLLLGANSTAVRSPAEGTLNCPICHDESGIHLCGVGTCPNPWYPNETSGMYVEGWGDNCGCHWRIVFANYKWTVLTRLVDRGMEGSCEYVHWRRASEPVEYDEMPEREPGDDRLPDDVPMGWKVPDFSM